MTTDGGYTQTINLPFDAIQLKLSSTLVPPQVLLEELNINGVRFKPEKPVLYRPLDVNGVVVPLQTWEWTLESDSGEGTLTQSSVVQVPELELRGPASTLVQRVDSTLTFGGSASGTIKLSQWEAVGDPRYMRLRAEGDITILGTPYPVDVAAFLGHTGLGFDI